MRRASRPTLRSPAAQRRLQLALALLVGGCGYSFVRGDAAGPVPALSIGLVRDLTTEGDLGVRLRRLVELRLSGRSAPRVEPAEAEVPHLEGTIASLPERTVGYDALGAVFEVRLRGRLTLNSVPPAPWPLWTSGDVERTALYPRGATAAATASNRRLALEAALSALADALMDRLLESPEVQP